MIGAMCGDIIGSVYEGNNIKEKNFKLFKNNCRFTDDSVMTAAIARACSEYVKNKDREKFKSNCIRYMQEMGRNHINAGYGRNFIYWLLMENPEPYNSYGNGSAMRVSPVGWVSQTLDEAKELAKISAEVSHNHPDGIAGAQAIAGSIWILLHNGTKEDIKKYVEEKYYDLDISLDEIRKDYRFDVSCKGSVPQAIEAFLEAENFEDTIRNAISIGGDSDTIAAIAGSLAEAHFGIPIKIRNRAITYLDYELKKSVKEFYDIILFQKEKYNNEGEER